MKALRDQPIDTRKILIAQQFQGVGDALEEQGTVDLELRNVRRVFFVGAGEGQEARFSRQSFVALIQCPIKLFVEHPHLQQLDIGEFQDGAHIVHLLAEEHGRMPIDYRSILLPERDSARNGVSHFLFRKRYSLCAQDMSQVCFVAHPQRWPLRHMRLNRENNVILYLRCNGRPLDCGPQGLEQLFHASA